MNKPRKNNLIWQKTDEEFKKILEENKGFEKIGLALGFKTKPGKESRNRIRDRALLLGIVLPKANTKFRVKNLPPQNIKKQETKINTCSICRKKNNKSFKIWSMPKLL